MILPSPRSIAGRDVKSLVVLSLSQTIGELHLAGVSFILVVNGKAMTTDETVVELGHKVFIQIKRRR